ncbi:YdgA family protein [Klebsiella pneumoniae subsp. pneumoniae]|nr:YdgA family protein [Klebsiella pneumoniae subsp. pneumoniae]
MNYTVNGLKLQGREDMGSGKLTLKVDNVDGQGGTSSVSSIQRAVSGAAGETGAGAESELYQQALTETLFNALPILLKGNRR